MKKTNRSLAGRIRTVALAVAVLPACVAGGPGRDADRHSPQAQPQLESVEVETGTGVVVAGCREAAEAGAAILAAGGNAVDAAVAAGFVTSATEI